MKSRSLGGTLRGTLRAKLASQLHKSVMKGQQDYSLPRAAVTSQLQYQFMAALERDLKGHKDTSSQQVGLGQSYDQLNEFDKWHIYQVFYPGDHLIFTLVIKQNTLLY